MIRNIKLVLEYDGSGFCGFQKQPDQPTIQASLEEALSRFFDQKVKITSASGRTDTGVHALGQVVNFKIKSARSLEIIQKGLNALLPRSVAVQSLEEVPRDFHARFHAKRKIYEYCVWNHRTRSPLQMGRAWHVPEPLNLGKMRAGARFLVGRHDFRSFCVTASAKENTVRTLSSFKIKKEGHRIRFLVEADGFLHHMVRNLVGTLLDMGREKMTLKELQGVLWAKNRASAGATAPPEGLTLLSVTYSKQKG